MTVCSRCVLLVALGIAAVARGDEPTSIRAKWEMPPKCEPFAPARIEDLREELRETGYRLVIAIHPERPANAEGEYP
ncbi:MAG: hypothetical protein ABIP48_02235, partial [Planctomycetota bacterium]